MTRTQRLGFVCFLVLIAAVCAGGQQAPSGKPRRNVIIFVADGLRHGSVNEKDTPALWRIRTEGVHFRNSYSVFPTFTTANAATIATGHHIGDTGDFSNSIWVGHATYDTGNYNLAPGTPVPFIENDQAIGDLNSHFGGNYLSEETFLELARKNGFNTAALGKIGPAGIQDATSLTPVNGSMPPASDSIIIIDDATGWLPARRCRRAFSQRCERRRSLPKLRRERTALERIRSTATVTPATGTIRERWLQTRCSKSG